MSEKGGDQPRPLGLVEAIVPVASLIVLVSLSYGLFGDAGMSGPSQVALTVATLIAAFVAWRNGHSLASVNAAAVESVSSGIGAVFILFAVGALIGAWAMSGTLVAMVYFGIQLLSPNYFYLTTAIVCAVISSSIGSSWTTAGTIGVGFMGIAANMGLDPAITAAAIISGAYFGDTTSPLSDSTNLASGTVGVGLYEHIRETALSSSIALALSLVLFWWLGRPGDFDASDKIAAIREFFPTSPLLFIPLALVAVMALLKFPPFAAIFAGALAGGVVAAVGSPDRVIAFADAEGLPRILGLIKGVWLALANGYETHTGNAAIDQLVSRGGMDSMLNTIWLVMTALAFGGVVEKAGVLDRLIEPVVARTKSTGAMISATVGSVVSANLVTADQYIAIVLPARMFKPAFARLGFAPVVLSRAVGATATPTSALVPWNSCGAYMAATLGVGTLHYAPYALFSMLSPLVVVALAFLNIRMPRSASGQG
ncbi:Na+/H+ antiporter NhaC family protein [Aestuariivirga sp.]|uniref:Na+/H+ antiporter NhaC family protein n=1 Tax=Aestuariivirga sp. TaxID=2650926 RepID=UPI0025BD9736|nr:Na+/H+ antiporter NhaC family protein [Aestuariivirga sp.]MCA3554413.1 Na+/H+ antiporter NhaC [Aestuariivirga sp.]